MSKAQAGSSYSGRENARRRFKRFHGREPEGAELARVRQRGDFDVFQVGKMSGIIYLSAGDGQTYIHKFKVSSRPTLYVSADGSQLFVFGGKTKFTERGFVDRKGKGSR